MRYLGKALAWTPVVMRILRQFVNNPCCQFCSMQRNLNKPSSLDDSLNDCKNWRSMTSPCGPAKRQSSALIFTPLVTTGSALVECRHRLIRRANLQLIEVRLFSRAVASRAQNLSLIDVVPGTLASHDIVDFLGRHHFPIKHLHLTLDRELVGAGPTFEP